MTEQQTLDPAANAKKGAPAPGTPVFVDVFATNQGGATEWSHEWRWGQNGPSEGNGTIEIPERSPNEPGTAMHFQVHDQTNPRRGYQFDENQGATMWVKRNACPPGNQRCDDGQIPPDQMHTTPQVLHVFNVNSENCNLHYRLWFKDKDGNPDSYDPDITNGGKSVA